MGQTDFQKERNLSVLRQCFLAGVGTGEGAGAGDSNLKELASIASQLLAVGTMLELDPPNHSENISVSLLSLLSLLQKS